MRFWNGNKSPARKRYEWEILQAIMDATHYPDAIIEEKSDYPSALDEGNVFQTGVDALVTVMGNPKFAEKDKIVISKPLAKGLLGMRLLVIRKQEQEEFSSIYTEAQMKSKIVGVPATWADADLFRANGYLVAEKGSLGDIFLRLADHEFDYVSLGAIEIEDIYRNPTTKTGDLCMEGTLMLQYPMPLVFYVNPSQSGLAERVRDGLQIIQENGNFDAIFIRHFGEIVQRLSLDQRRTFHLVNPMLSDV